MTLICSFLCFELKWLQSQFSSVPTWEFCSARALFQLKFPKMLVRVPEISTLVRKTWIEFFKSLSGVPKKTRSQVPGKLRLKFPKTWFLQVPEKAIIRALINLISNLPPIPSFNKKWIDKKRILIQCVSSN
jgi:hypothetical protein